MQLEKTISQLEVGPIEEDRATELGHMGYLQWLGTLPGDASYRAEAMRAYALANPLKDASPALDVFCDLLMHSLENPGKPITFVFPKPQRRGGARARRLSI